MTIRKEYQFEQGISYFHLNENEEPVVGDQLFLVRLQHLPTGQVFIRRITTPSNRDGMLRLVAYWNRQSNWKCILE